MSEFFNRKDLVGRYFNSGAILVAVGLAAYDLFVWYRDGCYEVFNVAKFCGVDAIAPALGQNLIYLFAAYFFYQRIGKSSERSGSDDNLI